VSFLEVGFWATFAPRSFYDSFPGFGQPWLAGDGPYNAHLATDAGVGFLAVGTVLLLAAVWMERRVLQAALAAAVLHGGAHLVFHLAHPNEAVGSPQEVLSNGGLLLGVTLALVLLVVASREREHVRDDVPTHQAPTVLQSTASDGAGADR
jgi:hypothetical protein